MKKVLILCVIIFFAHLLSCANKTEEDIFAKYKSNQIKWKTAISDRAHSIAGGVNQPTIHSISGVVAFLGKKELSDEDLDIIVYAANAFGKKLTREEIKEANEKSIVTVKVKGPLGGVGG